MSLPPKTKLNILCDILFIKAGCLWFQRRGQWFQFIVVIATTRLPCFQHLPLNLHSSKPNLWWVCLLFNSTAHMLPVTSKFPKHQRHWDFSSEFKPREVFPPFSFQFQTLSEMWKGPLRLTLLTTQSTSRQALTANIGSLSLSLPLCFRLKTKEQWIGIFVVIAATHTSALVAEMYPANQTTQKLLSNPSF